MLLFGAIRFLGRVLRIEQLSWSAFDGDFFFYSCVLVFNSPLVALCCGIPGCWISTHGVESIDQSSNSSP